MLTYINTPQEYVDEFRHSLSVFRMEDAIENNELPLGMSIDYALEVISILEMD